MRLRFFAPLFLCAQLHAGLLLVDIKSEGSPDLLCGSDSWAGGKGQYPSILNYRAFEMGPKFALWQWVGPAGALVVVSPSGPPEGVVQAGALVGTYLPAPQDKRWANAYEALANFDKDKDGLVSGGELAPLYLWTDTNINGLVDPGEAVGAGSKLVSFSLLPQDSPRPHWMERGATLNGGGVVSTWEWSPLSRPAVADGAWRVIPIVPPVYVPKDKALSPVVYQWYQPKQRVLGLYRFFRVGESLWVATLGPGYESSGVVSVGEVFVEPDPAGKGHLLTWSVSDGGGQWVKVEANLDDQGRMSGKVSRGAKEAQPFRAVLVKPPFRQIPPLGSFFAIPDSSFEQTVLSHFPAQLVVPFGLHFPEFSTPRGILDL